MKLKDQVAIVTGAGTGIGKAIALEFAREGAHIVCAARTKEPLERTAKEIGALGRKALVVTADQAKDADCRRTVEQTIKTFGRLDILVNNAGIPGKTALVQDVDLDDWNETMAVNVTGPMLLCKYAVPQMIKQGRGNIIMTSSGAGKIGYPLRTPYASSKWALHGLAFSVAMEVADKGIRCNLICPGATAGPRLERVIRARAEQLGQPYEQVEATYKTNPMKRFVTNEEMAKTALFLASDESSGITGVAINVDGGSNTARS